MGSTETGESSITDGSPTSAESGEAEQPNPERANTEHRSQQSGADPDTATTDEQLLALYATALADGVVEALPGWVAASVARRLGPELPDGLPEDFEDQVIAAGREAADEVGGRVRELLSLDIDEQWTNPLTLIRTAIRFPTGLLRSIGAEAVARDEQSKRFHPDDAYDLTPASFAELGQAVHDLGLSWGAAKAHVHLRRRREEEVA